MNQNRGLNVFTSNSKILYCVHQGKNETSPQKSGNPGEFKTLCKSLCSAFDPNVKINLYYFMLKFQSVIQLPIKNKRKGSVMTNNSSCQSGADIFCWEIWIGVPSYFTSNVCQSRCLLGSLIDSLGPQYFEKWQM